MVVGHGLDVVDRKTLARLKAESLIAWEEEVLSPHELAEANALRPDQRLRKLAGKFAAKEAVYKAVGGTITGEIDWTEIEIIAESSGRPRVNVFGTWKTACHAAQINEFAVSISHAGHLTFASAIALGQ